MMLLLHYLFVGFVAALSGGLDLDLCGCCCNCFAECSVLEYSFDFGGISFDSSCCCCCCICFAAFAALNSERFLLVVVVVVLTLLLCTVPYHRCLVVVLFLVFPLVVGQIVVFGIVMVEKVPRGSGSFDRCKPKLWHSGTLICKN